MSHPSQTYLYNKGNSSVAFLHGRMMLHAPASIHSRTKQSKHVPMANDAKKVKL